MMSDCPNDPGCDIPCSAPEHEWKPEMVAAIDCHPGIEHRYPEQERLTASPIPDQPRGGGGG